MSEVRADAVVIGGGIVGLATARALGVLAPGLDVLLLEKESRLAAHQTGRNSGVVHSGLYYRPGSAKARLCTEGREELLSFVAERGIAHDVCGKLVVATSASEEPALESLAGRAEANGVEFERVDRSRVAELEPHVDAVRGLLVPGTGIVDFVGVAAAFAGDVIAAGGVVRTSKRVQSIAARQGVATLEVDDVVIETGVVVNCAGLHSDLFANAGVRRPETRIVPFRGEYFELVPEARRFVRNLVYPVPDPRFPFLGVHLTRMIGGGVHVGPNAVLALAREGYRWRDIDLGDVGRALAFPGTRHLVAEHWRAGSAEMWRSLHKGAFVRTVQRLVPDVRADHLVRSPAGVRAQAVARDGSLLDDFFIVQRPGVVHVVNAPSPAATASMAIGRHLASLALEALRATG